MFTRKALRLITTQRRGKHSFLNNGGTRDLKRNEPRRDCDLSPNLVGSACNALFSALEPNHMRACHLGPCHVCTSCNWLYLWAINVIMIMDLPTMVCPPWFAHHGLQRNFHYSNLSMEQDHLKTGTNQHTKLPEHRWVCMTNHSDHRTFLRLSGARLAEQ